MSVRRDSEKTVGHVGEYYRNETKAAKGGISLPRVAHQCVVPASYGEFEQQWASAIRRGRFCFVFSPRDPCVEERPQAGQRTGTHVTSEDN